MGHALPKEQQQQIANDQTFLDYMMGNPMTQAMIHTTTAGTMVSGGADAKFFAASPIAKNVCRFTAVRVESAKDAERWHGVNEQVPTKTSLKFFFVLGCFSCCSRFVRGKDPVQKKK